MEETERESKKMVKAVSQKSSPLGYDRAVGVGISFGVNTYLKSLGLELNFIYILWGVALYAACTESKSFALQFDRFLSAFPREVCLLLEWLGSLQEVLCTFIMTNIGIWLTVMYTEASRPKPTIYAIIFIVLVGILLFQHKYAERSFFVVGNRGEKKKKKPSEECEEEGI